MKIPKPDNSGCIDHEGGIMIYCSDCPPCFRGTQEVCEAIRKQIEEAVASGK